MKKLRSLILKNNTVDVESFLKELKSWVSEPIFGKIVHCVHVICCWAAIKYRLVYPKQYLIFYMNARYLFV